MPDLSRADFPEVQMRREPRRADEIRPVALLGIVIECAGQKVSQRSGRASFARLPDGAKAFSPLDARLELQFAEQQRFRPARGRRELFRRCQRRGRVRLGEAMSPEWSEHLERLLALVLNRPRFM